MIAQKIICDRCVGEVKGGCYSTTVSAEGEGLNIRIHTDPDSKGKHYCGRQCLMLSLNEAIDLIGGYYA